MNGSANGGDPDVREFIGEALRQFFDVYLRDRGVACAVGTTELPAELSVERATKVAVSGKLAVCE